MRHIIKNRFIRVPKKCRDTINVEHLKRRKQNIHTPFIHVAASVLPITPQTGPRPNPQRPVDHLLPPTSEEKYKWIELSGHIFE